MTGNSNKASVDRRLFIGGSDARIIMSADEAALDPPLEGKARREPSRRISATISSSSSASPPRRSTGPGTSATPGAASPTSSAGFSTPCIASWPRPSTGSSNDLDAVFEAKFMLPWSFSEEAAAEKHMAQLQHNMWVTNARSAALSIITGGGKWIEMTIPADALYQHFLVTAERRFWRCVRPERRPRPYGVEPPRARIEAVRIVDMSESNSWAEFAGLFCATRSAFLDHERAKSELKALMPEDAKEASGHGVRAKRSKSGAVSFDLFAHGG